MEGAFNCQRVYNFVRQKGLHKKEKLVLLSPGLKNGDFQVKLCSDIGYYGTK